MTHRAAGQAPTPARLRAQDVSVTVNGRAILTSVSLEVPAGHVVGLIGPNGAGKTTLIDAICGVTERQSGQVYFDGTPLRTAPHRLLRLGIARTQQQPPPIEEATVAEHVLAGASAPPRTGFAAALRALPRGDGNERHAQDHAVHLLKELGLARSAGADPGALPYALRQRVALANALVTNPRLLLLDEPAGGLGRDESEELGQLIRSLVSRPGRDCAVLLVEHHVSMVMRTCDSVVVIDEGQVIAAGTPDEIRRNPVVVDAYLGEDTSGA